MTVQVGNPSESFFLRIFLTGVVSSAIAGIVYLACFKWAPSLLIVTTVTYTPDHGAVLPFTYPRGFDILMALVWGMLGAFLLCDLSDHIETKWARIGMIAGFMVGVGFLPTVGMAILPHLVILSVAVGVALGLSDYARTNDKDDRSLLIGYMFGTWFVLGVASLGLVLSLVLGLFALGIAATAREATQKIMRGSPATM